MDTSADIQTVDMTPDDENTKLELIAKLAAQTLCRHYPNHLWFVGWAPGGNLVVKHGAMDNRYGFVIHFPHCHSSSDFEQRVMRAGGEMLERLFMRRGAWNGDMPTKIDGVAGSSRILLPGDQGLMQ